MREKASNASRFRGLARNADQVLMRWFAQEAQRQMTGRCGSGSVAILHINRLAEPIWEIDEVAPTSIRLTMSHFDTAARGRHIAAIGGPSVESPICHKQRCVLHLHDFARRELDCGLHSNVFSQGSTDCPNASRWAAARHQESVECVQRNQRVKNARV